jgi:Ca2+-binding RTX toxin-like protein
MAIDYSQLETIQNITFIDFKNAYQTGTSIAANYYTELAYQGNAESIANIENYALLAKDVATNVGYRGQFANQFSYNVAYNGGINAIDFTVGGDNWLLMQYTLMREDFVLRKSEVDGAGTGELDFSDINDIHALAFDAINVVPQAYSLYTPLEQIAEYNTTEAQGVFESVLTDTGFLDGILNDALFIAFSASISGNQSWGDIARDYVDQLYWISYSFETLVEVSAQYTLSSSANAFINTVEALLDKEGYATNQIHDWFQGAEDVFEDLYDSVLDIPQEFLDFLSDIGDLELARIYVATDGSPNITGTVEDEFLIGNELNNIATSSGGNDFLYGDAGNDTFLTDALSDEEYTYIDGGADYDVVVYEWSSNASVGSYAVETQTGYAENIEELRVGTDSSKSVYTNNNIGFAYDVNNSSTLSWVDYSSATSALVFDLTSTDWTVTNTSLVADTYTNTSGATAQFIGSIYGDDITVGGYDANIWLGTGDDTVDASGASSDTITIHYSDGDDVVSDGYNISDVYFDGSIEDSDLSFNQTNISGFVSGTYFTDYNFDLDIVVSGKGTITIEDLHATVDHGTDMTYGTADDIYSRTGPVFHLWNGSYYDDDYDLNGSGSFTQVVGNPFAAVTLTGTSGADTMEGYGYNDTLNGGNGNDTLRGNGGADTLNGDAGSDTIYGDLGNDTLNGGTGNDTIEGGNGNDTINGNDDDDTLKGQNGDDTIYGGNGNDTITGGNGTDLIYGGAGADGIDGGNANDTIEGNDGDDTLSGGAGNDTIYGHADNDDLDGGDGNDYLYQGTGYGSLSGGAGDDYLHAANAVAPSTYVNYLDGGAGNDTLYGGGGTTTGPAHYNYLDGGDGDDYLYAGTGSTHFVLGNGSDHIYGVNDSSFSVTSDTFGNHVIHDNGTGAVDIDHVILFDTSNTSLSIDATHFEIDGDDLILTHEGNETGSIRIVDQITDTDPIDIISAHYWINISDVDQWILGTENQETLTGTSGGDILFANGGGDFIYANGGDDELWGSIAVDNLFGGSGSDELYGGGDNDILEGGAGADYLYGGVGDDVLTGGSDQDFFQFNLLSDISINGDHITDFWSDDEIGLGGLGPSSTFIGTSAFSNTAEEVRYYHDSGTTVIEIDADGDSTADHRIIIDNGEFDLLSGTGFGHDLYADTNNLPVLYGNSGNDTLTGTSGDDIIRGYEGDDTLSGQSGNDTYFYDYGDGYDTITDSAGTDTLILGKNINLANFASYRSGNNLILETVDGSFTTTGRVTLTDYFITGNEIETIQFSVDDGMGGYTLAGLNLTGTNSAETINGTSSFDYIRGRGGDDTINGDDGDDRLRGDDGNDIINGGLGDDRLEGGNGNDTYYYSYGDGYDTIEDGSGASDHLILDKNINLSNFASYRENNDLVLETFDGQSVSSGKVTIADYFITSNEIETIQFSIDDGMGGSTLAGLNLTGTNSGETINGTGYSDYIRGRDGNDTIYGGIGADRIRGDDGADSIYGGTDDDLLEGGSGNDILQGQQGSNTLYGGEGDDDLSTGGGGSDTGIAYGEEGNDEILGQNGDDFLYGDGDGTEVYGGDDTIYGYRGNDTLYGGAGADLLNGDHDDDILYGGDGNDELYGERKTGGASWTGNDILYGGNGNDSLYGEKGNDILYGGAGNDYLRGNEGADIFVFEDGLTAGYNDTIFDFDLSEGDKLDLSDLLAAYDPMSDVITDFVEITEGGGNTNITVDQDGGANNFVQIATVSGTPGLTDEAALESAGTLIV